MSKRTNIRKPDPPATRVEIELLMANVITNVLRASGRNYYDELSDDELFGWAKVLWEYHTDLRDEFARRELMKASHTWAASL